MATESVGELRDSHRAVVDAADAGDLGNARRGVGAHSEGRRLCGRMAEWLGLMRIARSYGYRCEGGRIGQPSGACGEYGVRHVMRGGSGGG